MIAKHSQNFGETQKKKLFFHVKLFSLSKFCDLRKSSHSLISRYYVNLDGYDYVCDPKARQKSFCESQNDSKTFLERFWNTKENLIFSWKKFVSENFSCPKCFGTSIISGNCVVLDEYDCVWDPKLHQKSFFEVSKWS